MRFRGQIQTVHLLPDHKALVLVLTNIEGMPEVGMFVNLLGETKKIIELGRNSTDGKAVSYRDCLTGQPIPAYGSICVDWSGLYVEKAAMHDQWVQEEAIQ